MAPAERRSLILRIVSSLVLAPVALAAAWSGWPWLPLVTATAGGVMAWEWARLCRAGRLGASGAVLIGAVLAAIAAAAVGSDVLAIAVSLIGAAIVFWVARHEPQSEPRWLALGALWVALPCIFLLWLARTEGAGRVTLLWIFAVVWATDVGAYAAGRLLGGPRLAPRWSPRKTWAGLIGGAGCAALAGWGTARVAGVSPAFPVVLVSAGLAIVGQFGDLAESVAKRRFGVKDSSGLIPGHGGLLDRLDGLLAVIPAVALLTLIGGGSVLTWR
ncbi:MAG TPA: phosphatidate cytidylyltransferase [Stellaceae bacterium]|nr:phosphatidate cytidylyltransferase [Stellaceae bacterium]